MAKPLPKGWSHVRLEEVAEFHRGLTWSKAQELTEPTPECFPVLGIPNVKATLDLSKLTYISGLSLAEARKRSVSSGWILMVGSNGNPRRVGNCAAVASDGNFLFGAFLIGISSRAGRIDPKFLFNLLAGPKIQGFISSNVQGSTGLNNINLPELRSLVVSLPPLCEQEKIAEILDSVEASIAATSRVIEQTSILKRAFIQELLTRGMPGRHTRFKASSLGPLPEDWALVKLEQVVIERPKNGISPVSTNGQAGIPTFSIAAVRNGKVNINDHVRLAQIQRDQAKPYEVHCGDILLMRGNANRDLVGTCGMVGAHPDGCIYPDILMRMRPNARIMPEYLVSVWNSSCVRKQIFTKAKTSNGTYKINQDDVSGILLPLPPYREQAEIFAIASAFDARDEADNLHLQTLADVKSALTSVLLSGKVRVRVLGSHHAKEVAHG